MDIHKPKPWHGVREFLKEYAIIVVGVLTALAFEQGAEALREHHNASEARENIKDELATDLANVGNRERVQPCIEKRLDEVEAAIAASRQPGFVRPTWIGRPQFWPIFQAKWQAATSAGRATLLSPDEQARYGQIYFTVGLAQTAENQEQEAWARLRSLEQSGPVTDDWATQLRLALAEARLANWQVKLFTGRARALVVGLGLPKRSPQHTGSASVCLPMNTPREVGLAKVNAGTKDPFGEP